MTELIDNVILPGIMSDTHTASQYQADQAELQNYQHAISPHWAENTRIQFLEC